MGKNVCPLFRRNYWVFPIFVNAAFPIYYNFLVVHELTLADFKTNGYNGCCVTAFSFLENSLIYQTIMEDLLPVVLH